MTCSQAEKIANLIVELANDKKVDKEKLQKIKSFCQGILDEHNSLPMDDYDDEDFDKDFFSWTQFDKIINIIDGEKK